jgi:hypothetical protein
MAHPDDLFLVILCLNAPIDAPAREVRVRPFKCQHVSWIEEGEKPRSFPSIDRRMRTGIAILKEDMKGEY